MNNQIPVNSDIVVNFAFPKQAPGVLAMVRGYHNEDLIVELSSPLADGSKYTIVSAEQCMVLPARQTRKRKATSNEPRSYDNSRRVLKALLMNALVATPVQIVNNEKEDAAEFPFRVFTAASLLDALVELLEAKGFTVKEVSDTEVRVAQGSAK